MFFDAGLKLDTSAATAAVSTFGKKLEDALHGQRVTIDTSKAVSEIKNLGDTAGKTFDKIKNDAEKALPGGGGGLLSGLSKSFTDGKTAATEGGGIFGSLAGSIGQLASPIGLATAAAGALASGLSYAFTVGSEFQQGLAGLSAITGLSGSALEDIGDRASGLAAKFGGSVSSQIESFQGILSKFGADLAKTPDDLATVSESVNLLAQAGGIDAATAMNTLAGSMLQFGVDTANSSELAAESSRFINVMAASARVGAAEIPQVGEAITVAGVAMKQANVSFEEGNAAIQVLAAGGKTGAEAGTALKNVLSKIAGEDVIPKEALAKLKSLGVDMKTVSNTALPLEVRMKELGKAAGDATALTQVFGTENSAAAAILTSGAAQIGKLTTEITGTSDATTQAAKNMDTFQGMVSRAQGKIEVFAISIFKTLSPIVSEVISSVSKAFSVVSDVLSPLVSKLGDTFGSVFERIGAVIRPVLAVIGGLLITNLVTTFSIAVTAITAFYDIAVSAFDAIARAVTPLGDTFKRIFGFGDDVKATFDPLALLSDVLGAITTGISKFGAIVSAVGGFLVEVLVVPLNIAVGAVEIVVGWIEKLVDAFTPATAAVKGSGEAVSESSGFFSKFIGVIEKAPEIITAITATFRAFVGAVGDLFTNFSFEKLGNLFNGKTLSDAYTGSISESNLKQKQELTLSQFGDTVKRLAELRKTANLQKDADQKFLDDAAFLEQKDAAIARLQQKTKANEITAKDSAKIIEQINALSTVAAKAEAGKASAADDDAAKKKKEKLKDIEKDIIKLRAETAKAEASARALAAGDEISEAKKKQEKALDDLKSSTAAQIATLKEAAEEKSKDEKISGAQRTQFAAATAALITAKEAEEKQKAKEINQIFAAAEIAAADARAKKALDSREELAKKELEAAQTRSTATAEEEKKRIFEASDLQIQLLKITEERRESLIIVSTAAQIAANKELQAAIISGDAGRIASAQKIAEEARAAGLSENETALKARKQLGLDVIAEQKSAALKIKELEISQITDSAERARQTRLLDLAKTLAAELAKVKDNATARTELEIKAAGDRLDVEEGFAKAQAGIFSTALSGLSDFAAGLSGAFRSAFAGQSDAQRTTTEDAKKENEKQRQDLEASLSARAIDYDEYQSKVKELNDSLSTALADDGDTFLSKFSAGFSASLDSIAAKFSETAATISAEWEKTGAKIGRTDKLIAETKKKQDRAVGAERDDLTKQLAALDKQQADNTAESAAQVSGVMSATTLALAATFGSSIAEGKKNVGEYLILMIDAVESMVPIFAVQIYGLLAGSPNPANVLSLGLAGTLAATGITIALTGLLEYAKSAIRGKHDGGYAGDGDEWEPAGIYHRKEYIMRAAAVKGEVGAFDRLDRILSGGESLSNIITAYESQGLSGLAVSPSGVLISVTESAPVVHAFAGADIVREVREQTDVLSRRIDKLSELTAEIPARFTARTNHVIEVRDKDPNKLYKQIEYRAAREAARK